jgi:hypothetical protein
VLALVPTGDAFQGWDLLADASVGPPLPGGAVRGGIASFPRQTALVEVDGIPLLCSARLGQPSVEFRDLRTGRPAGDPLVPTGAGIEVLGAAQVDGAPVLVVLDADLVLTHYDLRTRAPLGPPRPRPGTNDLSAFGVVRLGGRDRLVVRDFPGIFDHAVLDAGTFEEVASWSGLQDTVAELDGVPVLIGLIGALTVLDLGTGEELRSIPAPDAGPVTAAAQLDGRLLVAAGSEAGEITLYDVGAGTRVGSPLRGHQAAISTLAVVRLGDRPVLVSTSLDNSIRVWDLAVRAHS